MDSSKRNPKAAQVWYSVRTLAMMLELGESTLRRRIQAREFGPPDGEEENSTDYVVDLDGDIRVSTLGYFYYIHRHPFKKSDAVVARNPGELRRKLTNV
jgi:hypothetical protein